MHINGRMLHSYHLHGQHKRKADRELRISQIDKVVMSPKDKGVVSHGDNIIVHKASKRQQSAKLSGIRKVRNDHNYNYKRIYKMIYNTMDTYVPKIGLVGKQIQENVMQNSEHGGNRLFIQEPPATQIQTPGIQSKQG